MLVAASLLMVAQIPKRPAYKHYTNVRFAYAIDVPTFLKANPEPDNGDGRVFASRTPPVELRVYGGNYLPGTGDVPAETLAAGYAGAVAEGRREGQVRLAVIKAGFFAVSWESHGQIVYRKTIPLKVGGFATAVLTYPASAQTEVAPILTRTMRSLKALTR